MIADSHGEATVLFADLVGFSRLTNKLSPTHLVEMLNQIFSKFDELAERHSVEKIKTIGDCYMAVGGVPIYREGHSESVADFALDIVEFVSNFAEKNKFSMSIRIGICTGQVISGVIGFKKYTYDLWGDTVNLASRMESTSAEGKVHISEATYWRLHDKYVIEERGETNIKDFPNTKSYYLLRKKETATK